MDGKKLDGKRCVKCKNDTFYVNEGVWEIIIECEICHYQSKYEVASRVEE